ncbi:MAG TPA: response regulator [Phycisphaerae bacterium]|nr:response regulator [Phycisphaerae bacterium]
MVKVANANEIVFVDDEEAERLLMERFMAKSNVPNRLRTFCSGDALLSYLSEVEGGQRPMPAAAIIDVCMPEMDGVELALRLRRKDTFNNLPLLLFSSATDHIAGRRLDDAGVVGVRRKPASGTDYVAFLNSLI